MNRIIATALSLAATTAAIACVAAIALGDADGQPVRMIDSATMAWSSARWL